VGKLDFSIKAIILMVFQPSQALFTTSAGSGSICEAVFTMGLISHGHSYMQEKLFAPSWIPVQEQFS
jgi:hypothetical protein